MEEYNPRLLGESGIGCFVLFFCYVLANVLLSLSGTSQCSAHQLQCQEWQARSPPGHNPVFQSIPGQR